MSSGIRRVVGRGDAHLLQAGQRVVRSACGKQTITRTFVAYALDALDLDAEEGVAHLADQIGERVRPSASPCAFSSIWYHSCLPSDRLSTMSNTVG
ncbi:MAG: hypothetical protein IPK65_06650 [Gammaproteobacteria bacterium]|nr:hypothetical protein [Gammaproteobacteria bacterium]